MYLPDYDYVKIECVFFLLGKYYTSLRLAPISFLGHSALVAAAGPIAPGKICVLLTYRIVASASPSHFEANVGLLRLLMKGIFDPYVL